MKLITHAAMFAIVVILVAGCGEVRQGEQADTVVLLKCRFQELGYRDYECLQATPENSPLTDVNGVSRFVEEHGTEFSSVNCPFREEVDADYVCEDWIESKGCKLRKMFYTSQPGEKVYLYDCVFS
jgi:hypothetical protein